MSLTPDEMLLGLLLAERRVDVVSEHCSITPDEFPMDDRTAMCLLRSAYAHGYTDAMSAEMPDARFGAMLRDAFHARLPVDL